MTNINRRQFLQTSCLAASALLGNAGWAFTAPWTPGVESRVSGSITGEERTLQPDIWALEINYKQLRMVTVDLPDAKSGELSNRLVLYLAYRVVNRIIPGLPVQKWEPGNEPLFVPQFTLVTQDEGPQKTYIDRVMPLAQSAIIKRERYAYKNAVEIVGPVPPATAIDAKPGSEKSLDGLAMWRSVDPEADRFKIFVTGLSNGYRKEAGPDGTPVTQRKTLVLDFWRPGDSLDQNEREVRPNPKNDQPQWIYK
jgi:hypothetical protein